MNTERRRGGLHEEELEQGVSLIGFTDRAKKKA